MHGLTGTDTTFSSHCLLFALPNAVHYPSRIRIRIAELFGQRPYVRGIGALIRDNARAYVHSPNIWGEGEGEKNKRDKRNQQNACHRAGGGGAGM